MSMSILLNNLPLLLTPWSLSGRSSCHITSLSYKLTVSFYPITNTHNLRPVNVKPPNPVKPPKLLMCANL
jgi:hypothetical protein